jgi:UDP-glucuronate decarboxylase
MADTTKERKNVLITGGAGFIGSHLADELIAHTNVIVIDNFSSGREANIDHLLRLPNFIFIKHDLTEPIDLNEQVELSRFKVKFKGIQEIYHLAAPTSPKQFSKNRVETALANSHATANALAMAVQYNAKFLQFSSAVVYGTRTAERTYAAEDDLGVVDMLSKRACYDEGKRFAETLVSTYRQVYGIDAKIIRLFRTYGPRLTLNDGHMLSDFAYAALNNEDLVIFGDHTFSSSLVYISDVINAAMNLMKGDFTGPYNIGSDEDINMTDVAKKIIELTRSSSKIAYKDSIEFMSPLMLPRIERIKKDIGWFPIVRLDEGLGKTIDHLKAQKSLLRYSHDDGEDEEQEKSQ